LCAALIGLAGCKKEPSAAGEAPVEPASAHAAAATAPATSPSGTPLAGLDSCLVGNWKGNGFSLTADGVSAEGGAGLALSVAANGDSTLDFTAMAPVKGKGAGADFDFAYSGKASATLATPTRGAITSQKPDYAGLRVSANVQVPGAGKFPILKDKAVTELAQMASAIAAGKAPVKPGAAGTPPGIDSTPVFSTTRYTCEGDTLKLSADKPAAEWVFARVR
jgi:hypothetical protein